MKKLTLINITRVCAGRYYGPNELLGTEIKSVTTDSRSVRPGALFAALRGERTDGHRYCAQAVLCGAVCALVDRTPEGTGFPFILVRSVPDALQTLAAYYRRQFDIPVIGITGSVGKTTTKELLASVLGQRLSVLKTQGNLNNELGVPLTLFGLRERHGAAVIEMGISHFGEMRRLAHMVRPSVALFTVIGSAHLEFLGDRRGVLRAKTEMLEELEPGATVVINGDDDLLRGLDCNRKKLSFGLSEGCDFRAVDIRPAGDALECDIVSDSGRLPLRIPAYGEHMAYAAAAATAVGKLLGLRDSDIVDGVRGYRPVGSRSRLVRTDKLCIIDDCYNANPTSVASAIRSLDSLGGRRVCILGDMLELGDSAPRLHFEMGALALERGVPLVLTAGELSRETARGAGSAGRHFETVEELVSALPGLIREGDCVLVKASRAMGFERVTEALQAL